LRIFAVSTVILVALPGAVHAGDCPRWKDDPRASGLGPGFLVGVGSAPGEGPDAISSARQRALAAIAEQIRVQVQSSVRSEDNAVVRNGVSTETTRVDAAVRTDSSLVLDGAEDKESCTERGTTHVLTALDRKLFVANARQRLGRRAEELKALEKKCASLVADSRGMDAAALFEEAAVVVEGMDEDVSVIRIVGKVEPGVAYTPAEDLRRRARTALSKTTVLVKVTPAAGTNGIRKLAVNCVVRTGLAAVESGNAPDAVLRFDIQLEPPSQVYGSMFIVRATMTAALEPRAGEPVKAGADIQVKGGGDTPEKAVADALRRLGTDKLGTIVDELFATGGWKLKRCSANRG
jgi:hypothetical protein